MSESWATEEEFWGIDLKKPHGGFSTLFKSGPPWWILFSVVENTV